ncbi:MAG: hypothetical protein HOK97_06505 [Deltaproteobacteria bacterium]|jgi:hypothetical protein|nr:hypothetical protein [Deltaproteobacteria bacterium]
MVFEMTFLPIKPSDTRAWSECSRRVWLDNKGDVEVVLEEDAFAHLIIERGLEHEAAVLEQLSNEHDLVHATSEKETRDLMAKGADIIYQRELSDPKLGLIGKPDFLELKTATTSLQMPRWHYGTLHALLITVLVNEPTHRKFSAISKLPFSAPVWIVNGLVREAIRSHWHVPW